MDRCDCSMCNIVDGVGYCDYYDFMYQKCNDAINCPEDMDEDEEFIDDDDSWINGDFLDDDDFYDTNDTPI